jgi:hypothetical protein
MVRKNLTDRYIQSRKAAAPGRREDHFNALVPGLGLRVTDRGNKSFVLVARYPTSPLNPTRRSLGTYGKITLDDARQKAREWLALIQKGIDPIIEQERQRAAMRLSKVLGRGSDLGHHLGAHQNVGSSVGAGRIGRGAGWPPWSLQMRLNRS